jgi:NAD(P)-dependent dehydrogenase (short-subunit alcohol dehydrogenase family)
LKDPFGLDGKIALVTGARRGPGREIASALAEDTLAVDGGYLTHF